MGKIRRGIQKEIPGIKKAVADIEREESSADRNSKKIRTGWFADTDSF